MTTCSTTAFDFPQVVQQVVAGMFQNMLANDPAVSYVHQTNTMGTPPYSTIWPPANYVPVAPSAATATTPALTAQGTDGDGTLFEALNPLIAEYDAYFNTNTPYVQLSLGGIGNVFADQTAWSNALTAGTVTASETNGVVSIDNTGTTLNVPVTVPTGTTLPAGATLGSYGGELSDYMSVTGTQTLTENLAPTITSAASATSIVGAPFSFTVSTTGEPAPALTESGTLPGWPHLHRQRQWHGHDRRYYDDRYRGQLPDNDHRHQRHQPRRHPDLHADQRRGADHYQRYDGELQHGRGRHLHGDDDWLPGPDGH